MLVFLLGENWRVVRDGYSTYSAWRQKCRQLVDRLCKYWGPRLLPKKPEGQGSLGHSEAEARDYESLSASSFAELEHPQDNQWSCDGQRFNFISDSQVVVDILNGKLPLKDTSHAPIFQRIGHRIASMFASGWRPPLNWLDPFEWRPRSYNVRADAVCNVVLDQGQDLDYVSEDIQQVMAWKPHISVYTDGACRNTGSAAYSLVIYAVVQIGGKWRHFTLALQGRVLSTNASSFITESLAIDASTKMVHNIIWRAQPELATGHFQVADPPFLR